MSKTTVYTFVIVCLFSGALAQEYDYTDQANWGGACQDGMYQSPIDINSQKVRMCPDWGYSKITVECEEFMENFSGDSAEMEEIGNIYLFYYHELENWYEAYRATSMKWYTTSEHNINGAGYDAELEIFLESVTWMDIPAHARGTHADHDLSSIDNDAEVDGVIGTSIRFLFMIDDSEGVQDFYDGVRIEGESKYWNFNNMFGCAFDDYFYAYKGSKTVPTEGAECEEIVWNNVFRKPFPIKTATLDMIRSHITYDDDTNHRDIQDLGDREVLLSGRPCMEMEEEM